MKVFPVFVFILLCCYYIGQGQNMERKITGVIKDVQNIPVPRVSVSLLKKSDSTLIQNQITGANGKFVFKDFQENVYLLTCTYIGYLRYLSTPITVDINHAKILLPAIILQLANPQTLHEVTVTTQKRLIEEHIDRTVVNPNAMITAAGSNLLEILSKSPGVAVTSEGDISLNGKGALVLIDDKPTYLSVQDLAGYLKSIPAITIDKLELMTNPPAKYDASGGAVINIRLKKNKAAGFNGNLSVAYNQGRYGRSNNGLNLNYRTPKMNIFSNLSFSHDNYHGNDDNQRFFSKANGEPVTSIFLNNSYTTHSNGFNERLGADFFIAPKTILGAVISGGIRPRNDYLYYTSTQNNANLQVDSTGLGYTDGKYKWKNGGINLNFNHQFDQPGKELSADADYINYNSSTEQVMSSYFFLPDDIPASSFSQLFRQPVKIDIYSVKSDYTQPILKGGKLDAGIKSSIVNTDNQNQFYNQEGNDMLPDYGKTNHFIYRENINATYLNINKSWKKFSLQAGVRVEHTYATGQQKGTLNSKDSSFTKNYAGIFPTAYFLYKLDSTGKNTLTLSYGRRIRRPDYQQLNPFLLLKDQYSYTSGNPMLKPIYNNRIELKYSYGGHYNLTLAYSRYQGNIFSATKTEGNVFITRPENLLKGYGFGLIPNVSLAPLPWWNLNANVLILYSVSKGAAFTQKIDESITTGGCNFINQFKLNKTWSMEIFTLYRSKNYLGQTKYSAYWYQDAGIQKTMAKGKGSFKLSFNDIFHTFITKDQTIAIQQTSAFHSSKSDTQRIGLSFSYSFGKDAFARKRNRNNIGADTEQERVN